MRRRFAASIVLIVILSAIPFINVVQSDPGPTLYKFRPSLYGFVGWTFNVDLFNPTAAYDKMEATYTYFNYGKGPADTNYYEVKNIQLPSPWVWATAPPTIQQLDVKMKYGAELNDKAETYEISIWLGGSSTVLVSATGAAHANGTETWSSAARPGGGSWGWADITGISIRVAVPKKAGSSMDSLFFEFEAWVEITVNPPPPTAKLAITPGSINALSVGQTFNIDVNVTDIAGLWGYQYNLTYNTNVLNTTSVSSYSPFNIPLGPGFEINEAKGYVAVSYSTTFGEERGFWGTGLLTRITFKVIATGGSPLNLLNQTEETTYYTKLSDVYGLSISHTVFDGVYNPGAVPEFPLGMALGMALLVAVVYVWWKRKGKNPKRINHHPPQVH